MDKDPVCVHIIDKKKMLTTVSGKPSNINFSLSARDNNTDNND